MCVCEKRRGRGKRDGECGWRRDVERDESVCVREEREQEERRVLCACDVGVCVWRERERECVRVCVWCVCVCGERERESVCVCVREIV